MRKLSDFLQQDNINENIKQFNNKRTVQSEINRLRENLEIDEFIIEEDGVEIANLHFNTDSEYKLKEFANRTVFDTDFTDEGKAILKI